MSSAEMHWISVAPSMRRALRLSAALCLVALLYAAWTIAKLYVFLIEALPADPAQATMRNHIGLLALALLLLLVGAAHALLGLRRLALRALGMRLGSDGARICIDDLGVTCAAAQQVLRQRNAIWVNGKSSRLGMFPRSEVQHHILAPMADVAMLSQTAARRLQWAELLRTLRDNWRHFAFALALAASLLVTLHYARQLELSQPVASGSKQ